MRLSDELMSQFEQELSSRADDILARLLDDMDAQARRQLQVMIEEAMGLLVQELDGVGTATGAAASGGGASAQFAQSMYRIVRAAVNIGVGESSARSTVSSAETARSRGVDSAYKTSRAQQQSEAAAEVNKGNRNL